MKRTYVAGVTLVMALIGCGGDDDGGVPWKDYDPSVQARIDQLEVAKDCAALQAEFDAADANNDTTMRRTGHNNADLMVYIDDALSDAGCRP